MKYKGANKHSTEELEEIIEDLSDQLNENRIDAGYNDKLLSELSELVRDLYSACSRKNDDEVTAISICKALKTNLERFSRDNNFEL